MKKYKVGKKHNRVVNWMVEYNPVSKGRENFKGMIDLIREMSNNAEYSLLFKNIDVKGSINLKKKKISLFIGMNVDSQLELKQKEYYDFMYHLYKFITTITEFDKEHYKYKDDNEDYEYNMIYQIVKNKSKGEEEEDEKDTPLFAYDDLMED